MSPVLNWVKKTGPLESRRISIATSGINQDKMNMMTMPLMKTSNILFFILLPTSSRGPVFFTQLRTGLTDNPFYCYKFRTMRVNNESDSKQATKNDSRVTRLGAFLRKTSIDEFPQFFNVFRGEMSLVGPRPHMLKHTSEYAKIVDHYMIRQMLKPGITGWAQVNGLRGEISNPIQIQQRVACDLWYLEHWSIWLDIKIMFLTIYNVFVGDKHAY